VTRIRAHRQFVQTRNLALKVFSMVRILVTSVFTLLPFMVIAHKCVRLLQIWSLEVKSWSDENSYLSTIRTDEKSCLESILAGMNSHFSFYSFTLYGNSTQVCVIVTNMVTEVKNWSDKNSCLESKLFVLWEFMRMWVLEWMTFIWLWHKCWF
jgi:hypothetical protein